MSGAVLCENGSGGKSIGNVVCDGDRLAWSKSAGKWKDGVDVGLGGVSVDVDCWVVEESPGWEVADGVHNVEGPAHLGLCHVHVGAVSLNELYGHLFLERVVQKWGVL